MSIVPRVDGLSIKRSRRLILQELRKHNAIPLKFAYLGEGAHRHNRLVLSKEYGLSGTEANLLNFVMDDLFNYLPQTGVNVLDVGAGNGLKAVLIMRCLGQKRGLEPDYYPIDWSTDLQKIAHENVRAALPNVKIYPQTIDFEENTFAEISKIACARSSRPNLLLFLGHTLGNPFDRLTTLRNIASSMLLEDHLLIGIEITNGRNLKKILSHYTNPIFLHAATYGLDIIGVNRSDGRIRVDYDRSQKDVHVWFEPSKMIRVKSLSGDLEFDRKKPILLFTSHKFTLDEMWSLLPESGLAEVHHWVNVPKTYMLVLAKSASRTPVAGEARRV